MWNYPFNNLCPVCLFVITLNVFVTLCVLVIELQQASLRGLIANPSTGVICVLLPHTRGRVIVRPSVAIPSP